MSISASKVKNLFVGDLVTHVLYGKEWIGVIIKFIEKEEFNSFSRCRALVQIQPGTKYDGFFSDKALSKNRISDNLGYVSTNWLFRIEKENEK